MHRPHQCLPLTGPVPHAGDDLHVHSEIGGVSLSPTHCQGVTKSRSERDRSMLYA